MQNDKATTVVPADDKCSIIVNGDYYAGPNREIKTILRGIQAQLSEMQEQIREIQKENGNKTGKRERIFKTAILFHAICIKL